MKHGIGTIAAMNLLWATAFGVLELALPLYVASLGGSATQWEALAGLSAFAWIFAEPGWGWMSDRVGVVIPLAFSGLGSAIIAFAYALTGNIAVL